MPTWPTLTGAVLAGALLAPLSVAAPAAADAPPAFHINDPRITESSGLQASHRHADVYWTHNDQDTAPNIYAIDGTTGDTLATVTLAGVEGRDLEAISLGPEGDLYIGDIGDNYDGGWSEVWIYRIPEPETLADATVTPTVYTATYDDGPRDAEALMVHPETGRVYIASKKEDGGGALYAGPAQLTEAGVNAFQRVADIDVWVTDGAFSPDGTRLMLRGYFTAQMYRWTPDGTPEPIDRRVIPGGPMQGESVTFTPDGRTLMFGGEDENSEVEPVELAGELLPESARESSPPEEESDSDSDSDAAGGRDEEDDEGISTGTASTLIVGVLIILGVRYLSVSGKKKG
ncbi:hypothetical protein [Streptomyces litchfieldiae]|uniref:WD40 repeat domain-containing protein n=1 Tax=Streptomyces litchfieldiae TaxID=3075543 RepID=A0ABU2MNP1_9ACTN|nr:hypothetical protein [Streptomyces sp. DSM 44938]MDT0343236.1 hypothetical protein [Streptomyces sp. DSM 44938]